MKQQMFSWKRFNLSFRRSKISENSSKLCRFLFKPKNLDGQLSYEIIKSAIFGYYPMKIIKYKANTIISSTVHVHSTCELYCKLGISQ